MLGSTTIDSEYGILEHNHVEFIHDVHLYSRYIGKACKQVTGLWNCCKATAYRCAVTAGYKPRQIIIEIFQYTATHVNLYTEQGMSVVAPDMQYTSINTHVPNLVGMYVCILTWGMHEHDLQMPPLHVCRRVQLQWLVLASCGRDY